MLDLQLTASDGAADRWRFGAFEIDERRRTLTRHGEFILIEPKPFNLLVLLLRHAGELVTKEELFNALWQDAIVTDSVLTRCVAKLRQVLGEDTVCIATVHGYGYRLDGVVRRLRSPDETVSAPVDFCPSPGDAVPGRAGWTFERTLGERDTTWLIRHAGPPRRRVLKLGADADTRRALQREHALGRVLAQAHGERGRFVRVLGLIETPALTAVEFEYLPDGSLVDWCAAQGGITALSLQARLDIVIQVADALADVHEAGILHKDLKPSNILVDASTESPQVRLGDFGAGDLVQRSRLGELGFTRSLFGGSTSSGTGTLFYTAPEVLAQDMPSPRSDVYSLGVLLYQMLIGNLQQAFAPGWEREVEDEVLREDIAACADRDPRHRLGSARELAVRLRALAHRRRDRATERMARQQAQAARRALFEARLRRRWTQRLAGTLGVALTVSCGFAWRAYSAQQEAQINAATTEAINSFLNDELLAAANPYLGEGGRNVTIASVLDAAASRLDDALGGQPEVFVKLAISIGAAYQNLGLQMEARALYDKALRRGGATLGEASPEMRELQFTVAYLDTELGRLDAAARRFERLRELDERALGPWALETVKARYGAAWVQFEQGHFVEAAARFERLDEGARANGLEDTDTYTDIRWNRAEAVIELHEFDLAERLMRDVLDRYAQQGAGDGARLLYPNITLGYIDQMRGHLEAADRRLQGVYEQASRLLGDRHPVSYAALHHLGIVRLRQHRYAEAEALFSQVVDGRTRLYGEPHFMTRYSMNRLAQAWLALGRSAEAEALLARTWRLSIETLGESHPNSLDIARVYAEAQAANGELEAAESGLRRVLALSAQALPPNNNRIAATHLALAQTLERSGRFADARDAAAAGHRGYVRAFGPQHDESLQAEHYLARLNGRLGATAVATSQPL